MAFTSATSAERSCRGSANAVGGKDNAPPSEVRAAQKLLKIWRKNKRGRKRIPGRLWAVAVRLCKRHSVFRVARWLPLNYNDLRERVNRRHANKRPSAFISYTVPSSLLGTEYVVELSAAGRAESASDRQAQSGRTVSIRVRGATVSDVAALAKMLCDAET